jgi:hypothetical protein
MRSDSKPYRLLLALMAKTTFMNDLDKMRHGNSTSFVENVWSNKMKETFSLFGSAHNRFLASNYPLYRSYREKIFVGDWPIIWIPFKIVVENPQITNDQARVQMSIWSIWSTSSSDGQNC